MGSQTEYDGSFCNFYSAVALVHDTLVGVDLSILSTNGILNIQTVSRTQRMKSSTEFPVSQDETAVCLKHGAFCVINLSIRGTEHLFGIVASLLTFLHRIGGAKQEVTEEKYEYG